MGHAPTKVALVTGGARRLGAAICRYLAAQSISVAVHYLHSEDEARNLQNQICENGGTCRLFHADLEQSEETCRQLIRQVREEMGTINYLVNNASIFEPDRLKELDIHRARRQMWINAWAPLLLMQEFSQTDSAEAVVNLLDCRVRGLDPDFFSYVMSKKMLEEFTRAAACTFAPGVRVNAVAPGAVVPPARPVTPDPVRAGPALLPHQPSPEEIARAVHFLLIEPSITGQVLFVDSGAHLHA